MLSYLEFKNVGPAKTMQVGFKDRINVITGDNGLGKTFILDAAWWMLTRVWPTELNSKAASGHMLRPQDPSKEATIKAIFDTRHKKGTTFERSFKSSEVEGDSESTYKFNRREQDWEVERARPPIPGIVIYAQVDGGFSIWDPARNYGTNEIYAKQGKVAPRGYVFTPYEIWNGVSASDGTRVCKGIYEDLATWYTSQDDTQRNRFSAILEELSPIDDPIRVTGTKRIAVDDARMFPTISSNYGKDVPVIFASSAIKRIISLAYTLLWNWEEHNQICNMLGQKKEHKIMFLVDEIECHLHPKWQRTIVDGIFKIMKVLDPQAQVQLILTTHSPLVMASLESKFDPEKDTWNDIDYNSELQQPEVTPRQMEKYGSINNWLESEAFDISDAASIEHETLKNKCSMLYRDPKSKKAAWDECKVLIEQKVSHLDPIAIAFNYEYLQRFGNVTPDVKA